MPLAFVRRIQQWPVDPPHKGPVTRKKFSFHNCIMCLSETGEITHQLMSNSPWVTHSLTLGQIWRTPSDIYVENVHFEWLNQYLYTGQHFQADLDIFRFDLCLRNHSMFLHCFALTCKLKWDFYYNSPFLHCLSIGYWSCCNKNLMPVCTLKQNNGGTSNGFTNMKSNRNMSRSDWKYSPIHKYQSNHSKWTFSA